MPAYSFKAQFAEPILAGTKGGTIREQRRGPSINRHGISRPGGHAIPGEPLMLYSGMRTKQCRLIAERRCIAVEPIMLNFVTDQILVGGLVIWEPIKLSAFAQFDGFDDWQAMRQFWETEKFNGWNIRWLELPPAMRAAQETGDQGVGAVA